MGLFEILILVMLFDCCCRKRRKQEQQERRWDNLATSVTENIVVQNDSEGSPHGEISGKNTMPVGPVCALALVAVIVISFFITVFIDLGGFKAKM